MSETFHEFADGSPERALELFTVLLDDFPELELAVHASIDPAKFLVIIKGPDLGGGRRLNLTYGKAATLAESIEAAVLVFRRDEAELRGKASENRGTDPKYWKLEPGGPYSWDGPLADHAPLRALSDSEVQRPDDVRPEMLP